MSCFHFTWLLWVFFYPNCDLAHIVTGLSISFCSAAEIEMNSGPLYHRILDNCLSRTSRFTHAGIIYIPAIIVQAYSSSSLQQEAQNHRFVFFLSFFFVVVVRNYMVQVLNLEQGPSPPVKWVCHGWRRRMCSCVNEPPSPFRGWDLHPSLFWDAAHAVSCPLLFFHSYPLWIFSLFPTAALP